MTKNSTLIFCATNAHSLNKGALKDRMYLKQLEISQRKYQFIFSVKRQIKAEKMKLFRTVQNSLELLGYIRNHGGYCNCAFSIRQLRATGIFTVSIISNLTFTFHLEMDEEYMDSFYILTSAFLIFTSYMVTISEMTKLFDYIDSLEKVYENSKFYCNKIY